jgi:hypothetical protein
MVRLALIRELCVNTTQQIKEFTIQDSNRFVASSKLYPVLNGHESGGVDVTGCDPARSALSFPSYITLTRT